MKISIFSDTHCGYGHGTEIENDSLDALNEAIKKSLDSDLILIGGDIFDSRIPKQETFAKVAKVIGKAGQIPSNTKLIKIINKNKEDISPLSLRGIPVVAIHGNHERRSKYLINPVQMLEHSGLIIHLHCATAVFDINGKKVAIHGMSSVPERYAKDVLKEWDPKPIEDAINILMLHQSVDPYVYSPLEPPSLKLEDLPKGFDLYILGHIHASDKINYGGKPLLVPGSTIPTSFHKSEVESKRGIYFFDGKEINFEEIETRKMFFKEIELNENLQEEMIKFLNSIPQTEKKPVVMIKIVGKIKENDPLPSFSSIEKEFSNKLILKINRSIKYESYEKNLELLNSIKEGKISPEEKGIKIIQDILEKNGSKLKVNEIFDILVEGNIEKLLMVLEK